MSSSKHTKKIILFFILLLLFMGGLWLFFIPNTTSSNKFSLKIHSEWETQNIETLVLAQLKLKSELSFKLAAAALDLSKYKPGLYEISPGMNNFQIIRKLRSGKQTPVRFVLNNIQTKADFAGKVAHYLEIDSITVIKNLNDPAFCEALGFNTENILCLFNQNTYEFYWNISFEKFILKMTDEYNKFWNPQRTALLQKQELTKNQVYIIASLVQKEYSKKSERSRIAGVIINRLNIGMALQIDATCKFATGDFEAKRVTSVHTCYDSPYNTYKYKGLPPGPICMPEVSTIDAVLNAEKHAYLYYCARPDLSGFHEFSKSFREHMQVAGKYQKQLNKIGIH